MKLIERIKADTGFLRNYTQALSYLVSSGVMEVLRELGRVRPIGPEVPHYIEALAAQAEYSRGYNEALNDILEFRERFLDPSAIDKLPQLDFGAIDTAVARGDLTTEEANELRQSDSE